MSYQIKSTPYFKRILSTSKRNGELQRLKDEYERIKDFSDYTIALRIRQVRLRRLFREIQDINAASSARIRPPRRQHKTYEQMRAETLARARDLGTEFSRENGLNVQRYHAIPMRQSLTFMGQKPLVEKKMSTTARRLHYGNVISHENMRRFRTSRRKVLAFSKSTNNELRSASSIEVDRVEKLHNRISYGGSRASVGILKSKTYITKIESLQSRQKHSKCKVPTNSLKTMDSSADDFDHDVIKNYTFILEDPSLSRADYILPDIEVQEEELANIWTELKSRIPILKAVPLKELMRTQGEQETPLAIVDENMGEQILNESCDSVAESSFEEYALRKIDNDRNLPLSQLRCRVQKTALTIADSNEDIRIAGNEELIKVSQLNDEDCVYYYNDNDSEKEALRKSSSTECSVDNVCITDQGPHGSTHNSLQNKPLSLDPKTVEHQHHPPMLLHSHVKDFVKLYEPFPRREATESEELIKQNYETGVAKLRSIFEHQGE